MSERKIIFKARVGSHLHGTSTPKSDEDFLGVFLPSTDDLLGLQNRPPEWTENEKLSTGPRNTIGDKDCKYLALYTFLNEAAQGQSQALELLFIPDEHVIIKTPEWDTILANKHLICSQDGITPIIGFARAQAMKAVLKGANLNKVQSLIKLLENKGQASVKDTIQIAEHCGRVYLLGEEVELKTNDAGFTVVRIASREYDVGLSLKRLRNSLIVLEEKYGTRTRAAAENVYDYKSTAHAFRLVSEAKEFLATGTITFPRPDAKELLEIKLGNYDGNLEEDIEAELDIIRQIIKPNSPLPEKPNHSKLNKLCKELLKEHLK